MIIFTNDLFSSLAKGLILRKCRANIVYALIEDNEEEVSVVSPHKAGDALSLWLSLDR